MARPHYASVGDLARVMRKHGIAEVELFEDGTPSFVRMGEPPESSEPTTAEEIDCDGDDEQALAVIHELYGTSRDPSS
jgi:hypothetical protein